MKKVFEKSMIGTIELKNRILRSATHEGMGDKSGKPLRELYDLYEKLSKGDVGAIITGYVGVKQNGKAVFNMRMFDKDDYIDDYKDLNLKLKNDHTPVILQLAHSGSQTSSKITGEIPLSVSPTKNLYGERCKEVGERDIEEIIDCFVKSIERAKKLNLLGSNFMQRMGTSYPNSCLHFLTKEEINGVETLKIDSEY